MIRNRALYLMLVFSTIAAGLASRYFAHYFPEFINLGLGDALYALMMFWIIGFVFNRLSSLQIAAISLGICFLIETSQLIQTDLLIAIRSTRLGALILGNGFLWSDWLAYTIGVAFGFGLEQLRIVAKKKTPH